MTRAELRLEHERWAAKLARAGFVDIEHPSGRLRTWGHEAALHPNGGIVVNPEAETSTALANHPHAVFWREATHAVTSLHPHFPGRRLLEIWTETGNLYEAARRCRVTVRRALTIVARMRRHIEMEYPLVTAQKRLEDAPAWRPELKGEERTAAARRVARRILKQERQRRRRGRR